MKKYKSIITLSISALVILTSQVAFSQTKVDAGIKTLSFGRSESFSNTSNSRTKSLSADVANFDRVEMADVFIKGIDAESVREIVESTGGRVHMISGSVISASVDMEMIDEIAGNDEIDFIEAAKPIGISNDVASLEINMPEAHQGMNLPEGYTGKGVIVGVIDTGIDYTHPDFLDDEGRSRIISIWNQTKTAGPAPSEIENSFGTECDDTSIMSGSCPLSDFDGHGTHVVGTAAGNSQSYGGVAPDANIIVVSYDSTVDLRSGYAETIFSTKICQAAYYIFSKAESMGMPAVINLSLGTHIGPHDGTSLFEECLAGLVEDSAGRAIVAAAGNEFSTDERFKGIHAGSDVNGTVASGFVIRKITADKLYYIDLWGSEGSDLSIGLSVTTPSGEEFSGFVDNGSQNSGNFLDGKVEYMINFSETASALNGKPHGGIRLKAKSSVEDLSGYTFNLVVSGNGSFDAWLFPDKPSKTIQFTSRANTSHGDWTSISGDSLKSIAIPATSPAIIAVGAYATRNRWEKGGGSCEAPFDLGELLDFSSSGPTADPSRTGIKPEITAPGGMIASALSSKASVNNVMIMADGLHSLQAGTSMAAPFVSGTIALMFSADPNFTNEDVKSYIIDSAYIDSSVGTVPNDRWGFGKLDVLAAVEIAVNGGASGHFERNESLSQPQEAASLSSNATGCTLSLTQATIDRKIVLIGMVVISIAFIAIRKRMFKI